MYILLLNHIFDLLMLQAKNFHILFYLLTEYDLYLLPSLSFFRLGVAQHYYYFCYSALWWIWSFLFCCRWSLLDFLLDIFWKSVMLTSYFITWFGDLYTVFIIVRYFGYHAWFWLSWKRYVFYDYKSYFPTKSFNPFFKQNSTEISVESCFTWF